MPKMPNIAFLRKVQAKQVCNTFSYSARTGGKHGFRGGEATYVAHRKAGYVNHAPGASLGAPGYVSLTERGERALAEADAQSGAAQ